MKTKGKILLTSEQMLALEVCKSYMDRFPKETIWGHNVQHIREIHDKHFPDTECFTCILVICQFFSQLMSGLQIGTYFELREQIDSIMKQINDGFKDYEGNSIKLPSHQ